MIYVLNKDDINSAIDALYYAKGVFAGLSASNPLPFSLEPRLQDLIEIFKNIRDSDEVDFMKEGD